MDISYGICVSPEHNPQYLIKLLSSIYLNHLDSRDSFEIILIGDDKLNNYLLEKTEIISFDETQKPGWITKKKNIIAQVAKHDTLCILHDYYELGKEWLSGVNTYTIFDNPDWFILMNRVLNKEGTRGADWLVSPKYMEKILTDETENILMSVAPHENHAKYVCGLPYNESTLSHIQYISGGYFLCRKEVLLNVPFDEKLAWGDAEDVEWSFRVLKQYQIEYNYYSTIHIQKPKKWEVFEMPPSIVEKLKECYRK